MGMCMSKNEWHDHELCRLHFVACVQMNPQQLNTSSWMLGGLYGQVRSKTGSHVRKYCCAKSTPALPRA